MATVKNLRNVLPFLLLAVLLVGCGSESSSGPASQKRPAEEAPFLGYADLNDTSVTSLQLSTSSEYDSLSNEVRFFALVKDQSGNPLMNFNVYNFVLTLDSRTAPQIIAPADMSLSIEASADRVVAIVIDSSGSMSSTVSDTGQTRMEVAKEAAKLFVSLMEANDRAAVVTFSSSAQTIQPLTGDKSLLVAAIDSLEPDGATNFGAAIRQGVAAVGTRPGKRAMILLTDGDDTVDTVTGGADVWLGNPNSTRNQGVLAALENEFTVFTVGLGDGLSDTGLGDLTTIAAQTGGEFFQAPQAADLLSAFQNTIPAAIDGLQPVETYVLTTQSPARQIPGVPQELSYRLSALYVNGAAVAQPLRADSTGSYRVP